jgi:tetrahydromethanopterin S-methyltransferase subunit C
MYYIIFLLEWTMRSYTNRSQNYAGSSTVFYDIKITRKPSYYITTFVWPIFFINCLSLIGIFSPFNAEGGREEKVTMGLTTLLTMAVILMIIAGDMPASADGVPLLGEAKLVLFHFVITNNVQ